MKPQAPPKPFIIYPAYSMAVGLTVLLIAWAALGRVSGRRRRRPASPQAGGEAG